MRKYNPAARAASNVVQFFDRSLLNEDVKFPNLRFERHGEHTTVNLSFFFIFTPTAHLPVHLQRALTTIKDAKTKQ